jgi:hypothetical protein
MNFIIGLAIQWKYEIARSDSLETNADMLLKQARQGRAASHGECFSVRPPW